MNKKSVFYKSAAVFIVIAAVVSFLMISDRGLSEDKEGVDFTFNDLNNKPVKLSDFRGKIVIVDIWATWCPPCRQEIPGFINLYNKYKDKGLVILGVSVDKGGAKVVKQFAKEFKVNYPLLMGEGRQLNNVLQFIYIPTTYLIDEKGRIVQLEDEKGQKVDKFVGFHEEELFEKNILRLLKNLSI